jgi:glutaminase
LIKFNLIDFLGEYVGFNNAVFLSERATADRNMALAYFMQENRCFPKETRDLMEALDFYFMLCSLEVTCDSLSVMAATLANGGKFPKFVIANWLF